MRSVTKKKKIVEFKLQLIQNKPEKTNLFQLIF